MNSTEITINLPEELIAEWKFLVEARQAVEEQEINPIAVLRQAIATETYLWQQKASANQRLRKRRIGRMVGNS